MFHDASDLCLINDSVHFQLDNNRANDNENDTGKQSRNNGITKDLISKTEPSESQKGSELHIITQDDYGGINENMNIYRYKIKDELMQMLYEFSKIHQYDHRKDFKEAWNKWVELNDEDLMLEKRRLHNIGYDGDVLDKMFKSARYYFRKKSTEKKAPKERRNYIGVDKALLYAMDEHIKKNNSVKPEFSFDEFCKENVEFLKNEITRLCGFGITDPTEIKNKIKKTYKNRYFMSNKK